jgi:hypothetical protein
MLLVPKQLRRNGMTGNVPYYGGRLTPAQAYAASHRSRPQPRPQPQSQSQFQSQFQLQFQPQPQPAVQRPPQSSAAHVLNLLQQLLDSGVITPKEHQELRARVTR